MTDPLFQTFPLNEQGKERAKKIRDAFNELLARVSIHVGGSGRELALMRTHLEHACFFAVKAMSSRTENQE